MADDALTIAIRAEEQAKAAHHRLDRMNGSIDRLAGEVRGARDELNAKLGQVLVQLAHDDGKVEGATEKEKGFLGSVRFYQTIAFGMLPVFATLVAAIIYLKASG